ncbi:hypothetical protein Pint_04768 [Pistacia integerrima]|uniref:Uncharacterized protein n=1 Tax=Pistacia integerrima TaxID=434235 RepID=A0ACC0Z4F9_9ROSI|nr:hypothetical protein Pint_04768 [Pistacia integerrima]
MGSFYLPKDEVSLPLGQDAHFVCQEKQTFGVADGVGGWNKRGIDAGIYARELMTNSLIALSGLPKEAVVDPKKVLKDAYSITTAQGSSTACIVTLKDYCLHAANVGDSGFMQFRNKKFIYQSPVQQRCFNCPYQLGNGEKSDRPDIAEELKVMVESGDIVVCGSDGLLDNMFPSEIEEILKGTTGEICPESLAENIAKHALYNSFDRLTDSPFARAAKKAKYKHVGGKIDDISVIVAIIKPSSLIFLNFFLFFLFLGILGENCM